MHELMRERKKNHRASQSDGRRQTKKRETVKGGNPSDFTLYSRPNNIGLSLSYHRCSRFVKEFVLTFGDGG